MNISWLQTVYIVGALLAVALAILIYPTLKHDSRSKKKSSK